ncbi:MAG: lasso peptide biosynthesis B2 protein, partial [Pseudomonadota bacterium]
MAKNPKEDPRKRPRGLARLAAKSAAGLRLPPKLLLAVLASWVLLFVARALIIFCPTRWLARFYGVDQGVGAALLLADHGALRAAARVRKAIEIALRSCPAWANCYPQALVARFWLWALGHPHVLFFGLRKNGERSVDAHAWVMVGALPVTGGDGFAQFTVV